MEAMTNDLTGKYLERFGGEDQRHLRHVKKIRREVLYDESLPDLDRAVLGMTGSSEKLEYYRKMNEKIEGNIGKPAIEIVEKRANNLLYRAIGGVIAGGIQVRFAPELFSSGKLIRDAYLEIPLDPPQGLSMFSQDKYGGREHEIYYPKPKQAESFLSVAAFGPNNDYLRDLEGDRVDYEYASGEILVGREEVYGHPLFHYGISNLLQAIEEYDPVVNHS